MVYFINHLLHQRNRIVSKVLKQVIAESGDTYSTFLDAGCGEGMFLIPFALNFPNKKFIGVDQNYAHIHFLTILKNRKNLNHVQLLHAQLEENAVKSVDCIYSIGVLQYIKYPEKLIESFYNVLQENGTILMYLPVNSPDVLKGYRSLYNQFANYEIIHKNHFRPKHSELLEIIGKSQFTEIQSIPTNFYLAKLSIEIYNLLLQYILYAPVILRILASIFILFYLPFHIIFNHLDGVLKWGPHHGVLIIAKKT